MDVSKTTEKSIFNERKVIVDSTLKEISTKLYMLLALRFGETIELLKNVVRSAELQNLLVIQVANLNDSSNNNGFDYNSTDIPIAVVTDLPESTRTLDKFNMNDSGTNKQDDSYDITSEPKIHAMKVPTTPEHGPKILADEISETEFSGMKINVTNCSKQVDAFQKLIIPNLSKKNIVYLRKFLLLHRNMKAVMMEMFLRF